MQEGTRIVSVISSGKPVTAMTASGFCGHTVEIRTHTSPSGTGKRKVPGTNRLTRIVFPRLVTACLAYSVMATPPFSVQHHHASSNSREP